MSDHTLKDLMEDLSLQSEIHDKEKLKQRREAKLKEKEHKNEIKRSKRPRRVSRQVESEDERRLRKYGVRGALDNDTSE